MKVAIFTDTFLPDVNGVARTLGRWAAYLEKRGVSLKIFAPETQDRQSATYNSAVIDRFYSIPFLLYPECKLAIPNPNRIRKALAQFKPDLIHVATPFNLGLYGQRYAHKHNIPLVASYHTHFDQYLSFYKLQWLESTLWRYVLWFHHECRRIYVPSQSTLTHLEAKGLERLEIWSRGVDVSRFHPMVDRNAVLERYGVDPNRFVFLYVGRIAPEKNVELLLAAYESLPEDVKQASQLLLVGDGPLMKDLEPAYRNHDRIKFTGFMDGKPLSELFAAADVFWFPSATETFGNVVLEAMASGTAVIGARAGGVQDMVKDGQNGLLCEAGSLEANREAALRLFRDRELVHRLSREGRAYSLQQSWDAIFGRLYDSYREVIGYPETKKVESPPISDVKIGLR